LALLGPLLSNFWIFGNLLTVLISVAAIATATSAATAIAAAAKTAIATLGIWDDLALVVAEAALAVLAIAIAIAVSTLALALTLGAATTLSPTARAAHLTEELLHLRVEFIAQALDLNLLLLCDLHVSLDCGIRR
jgi:hypothetical protein